jgi:hypothetical protein
MKPTPAKGAAHIWLRIALLPYFSLSITRTPDPASLILGLSFLLYAT